MGSKMHVTVSALKECEIECFRNVYVIQYEHHIDFPKSPHKSCNGKYCHQTVRVVFDRKRQVNSQNNSECYGLIGYYQTL